MVRRVIAAAVVAWALTAGLAGTAGAAALTGGSGSGMATVCARLSTIEARVQKYDNAVKTRVPKAEAREAKLKSEGHDKRAAAIAKRIANAQNREAKLNARLAKVEARCGSGATSGPPASSNVSRSSGNSGNTL